MKKFINNVNDVEKEMMEGIAILVMTLLSGSSSIIFLRAS